MHPSTTTSFLLHDSGAAARASRKALVAWSTDIVIGVGLAYLVVIGLSPYVFWPTTFSLITLALFGALTMVWGVARWRGRSADIGWTTWSIGGLLAAGLLVVTHSIAPASSWTVWWQTLVFGTTFLMLADLASGSNHRRAVDVVLWAGLLAMLWHWSQVTSWYGNWLTLNPGVWLPTIPYRLANPNPGAQQLTLLLLPAVLNLWKGRGPRRWLMVPYVLSLTVLLFLTSSRGGWMGSAAGLASLTLLLVPIGDLRGRALSAWRWVKARPIVAIAVILLGLLALAGIGFVVRGQLDQPSRGGRLEYWIPAWTTFLSSPIWGQGQGTYAVTYMRAQNAPPAVLYHQAHSIYFNTLAEAGLCGFLGGAAIIVAMGVQLWRRRKDTRPEALQATALALAVMTAFLVHGSVDTLTFDKGNILIMALLVSAGFEGGMASGRRAHAWGALWNATLALTVIGVGVYGIWRDDPVHRGVDAASRSDWLAATEAFTQGVERDPASPAAWQQLGLAQARLADEGQTAVLDDAIASFERAEALDPNWPANALNLGALYETVGDDRTASTWYERAVRLAPQVPMYHIVYARSLESIGDGEQAESEYARGLDLNPSYAYASYWAETTLRGSALAKWSAVAHSTGPTWTLATNRGVSDLYLSEGEKAMEAGDLDGADYWLGMADLGFWADPTARMRWGWRLAEMRARRGDSAGAISLATTLFQLVNDPSSFGPGTVGGSIYGTYVALRPTMDIEMVPQVFDLGTTVEWPERRNTVRVWCADLDAAEAARYALCASESVP